MYQSTSFFLALSLVLGTASCSTASLSRPSNAPIETRSYLTSDCLLDNNSAEVKSQGLFGVILVAMIPKAIEWTIDRFVEDLNKIDKTESASSNYFYLYTYDSEKDLYPRWNRNFGCITTITGSFSKSSTNNEYPESWEFGSPVDLGTTVDLTKMSLSDSRVITRLGQNGIHVEEGKVLSIQEVSIKLSEDETAFRFENRFFYSRAPLNGKKQAGVVYTYVLSGPGVEPDGSIYFAIPISRGAVGAKDEWRYGGDFSEGETGWVTRTGMSLASLMTFFSSHKKSKEYTPVRLTVTNTHTTKPSDGAKLAASFLNAIKTPLAGALGKEFTPEDIDTAAEYDAQIAVAKALVSVEKAKQGSEEEKNLAELELAKACLTVRKIGLNNPSCSPSE